MNILSLKNFACGYTSKLNDSQAFIVKDIDLDIKKGSFAGIVGPNGAGKSTLFKGLTGEINQLAGEMKLNKQDLNDFSLKKKAQHIAVVSQDLDDIDITVEEYVLLGRYPYREKFSFWESEEDYQIAHKYLKMVGVWDLKDKIFSQISGGQKQLVSIAKALCQEPEMLLLDEPTSHLDIKHQVQSLDLLQELNRDLNLSILIIIHDLNLAGEYCSNIIMMKDAKVYQSGAPEEVLTYQNIENVYQTPVIVQPNPISQKPAVFPISKNFR